MAAYLIHCKLVAVRSAITGALVPVDPADKTGLLKVGECAANGSDAGPSSLGYLVLPGVARVLFVGIVSQDDENKFRAGW
jgi:hypothetical protein